MPRQPRYLLPGGVVHITARGNRRAPIFHRERDGYQMLAYAGIAFARYEVVCRGYCLMPNHYHYVLDAPQPNLTAALRWLNGCYARWFNDRYDLTGHVFEARFFERIIFDEEHFYEVLRYTVLNPVRAKLCRHPREWRWSSYRASVGTARVPALLSLDWQQQLSAAEFATHVEEGLVMSDEELATRVVSRGQSPGHALSGAR